MGGGARADGPRASRLRRRRRGTARRGAALATCRTCGGVGMLVGPVALGAAADAFGAHGALGANGAVLGASALGFAPPPPTETTAEVRRGKNKSSNTV